MKLICKAIKAVLLFPLYIFRTHTRVSEIEDKLNTLRRLLELQMTVIPALVPARFRPVFPRDLVRIGGLSDGGYLIPSETLVQSQVLVSYGIHLDWEFEQCFARDSGAEVHAYDKTTVELIARADPDRRQSFHSFFNGHPAQFYGSYIGDGTGDTVTVEETLRAHSGKRIFMKFDIEGAEFQPAIWSALLHLPPNVIGLVAEFHEFALTCNKVDEFIRRSGMQLVHLHINNGGGIAQNLRPNLVEITLARAGYYTPARAPDAYPLQLDRRCDPHLPDLRVVFEP